jgi:hypothetical protein
MEDVAGSDNAGLSERAIARKHGIRELIYPDSEQIMALSAFLTKTIETRRARAVPKTAVLMMADFLQATINRQNITKGPRMSHEEFDVLQAPYYLAARIVTKIQRNRQGAIRGRVYETTYLSLNDFVRLLRQIADPLAAAARAKSVEPETVEKMEVLREFLTIYSEQRRKSRPG